MECKKNASDVEIAKEAKTAKNAKNAKSAINAKIQKMGSPQKSKQ